MLTIPLTLAQAAASAYVLFACLMVLRVMTHSTRHLLRLSYLLLSAGALYSSISALYAPSLSSALLAIGVALFIVCDDRSTPAVGRRRGDVPNI